MAWSEEAGLEPVVDEMYLEIQALRSEVKRLRGRTYELYEIEANCHDCGEGVGLVDLGDINGVAAMGWRDFVVREIAPRYESKVVAFHVECEPS